MGRTCGEPGEIELAAIGVALNGWRTRTGEVDLSPEDWVAADAVELPAHGAARHLVLQDKVGRVQAKRHLQKCLARLSAGTQLLIFQ